LSAANATVSNGMAMERAKKLLAPFLAPEAVNEFERDILATDKLSKPPAAGGMVNS